MAALSYSKSSIVCLPPGHTVVADVKPYKVAAAYVQMPANCCESVFLYLASSEMKLAGYIDPLASWEDAIVDMIAAFHPVIKYEKIKATIITSKDRNIIRNYIEQDLVQAGITKIEKCVGNKILVDFRKTRSELLRRRPIKTKICNPGPEEHKRQIAWGKTVDRQEPSLDGLADILDGLLYSRKWKPPEHIPMKKKALRSVGNVSRVNFLRIFQQ